ncbi:MAG: hypothetical protein PHU85_00295 [Phycisphaerae bacterium]|nr:hypothetical protein [Phycisphaerae bacterium]
MTLTELETLFRELIFDKAPTAEPFVQATIWTLLNASLQKMWNLARTVQQGLFLTEGTLTLFAVSGPLYVATPTNALGYTRVKKIIAARRTDGADAGGLDVVRFDDQTLKIGAAAAVRPRVCTYGEQVGVLNPPAAASLTVYYHHGLPNMTAGSDTPGKAAGVGTADKLPLEWHPLIAKNAAALALRVMRAPDWQSLYQDYAEDRDELLLGIRGQENTAENG